MWVKPSVTYAAFCVIMCVMSMIIFSLISCRRMQASLDSHREQETRLDLNVSS